MTEGRAGSGVSRRALFAAGGVGAGAAAGLGLMGAGASRLLSGSLDSAAPAESLPRTEDGQLELVSLIGDRTEPFHGPRQAGIDTPAQGFASFVAIDLAEGTDRAALRRLLTVLTQDAADLTAGQAPLGDQEPEMAQHPSMLTVTLGFGRRLLEILAPQAVPDWLGPLPAFGIDRLEAGWSGGDLLLQLCAEDPLTLSHAQRVLVKSTRSFGSVRWTQDGFRTAAGARPVGTTPRNLFGQVDGTVDTAAGSPEHERIVWGQGQDAFAPWIPGGTSLVLRRIRMDLDAWDEVDRVGREDAVGRDLAVGAPLTGTQEHDEPDFEAVGPLGFPVIPDYSHMRRARHPDERVRIHRRVYSYDLALQGADGAAQAAGGAAPLRDSGLLFASYQADVTEQFLPIQRRLDELDMLNTWTAPVGSAVFAIPPGCGEGGFIGEQLW